MDSGLLIVLCCGCRFALTPLATEGVGRCAEDMAPAGWRLRDDSNGALHAVPNNVPS